MSPASHLLRGLVFAYRGLLSPIMPAACRFRPTCSEYSLEAIGRFGAWRGARLTAARLIRCHPWGKWGYDPVPESDAAGRPAHSQHSVDGCRGDPLTR